MNTYSYISCVQRTDGKKSSNYVIYPKLQRVLSRDEKLYFRLKVFRNIQEHSQYTRNLS